MRLDKIDLLVERDEQLARLARAARQLAECAQELAALAEHSRTHGDTGLRLAADRAANLVIGCAAQVHTVETFSFLHQTRGAL